MKDVSTKQIVCFQLTKHFINYHLKMIAFTFCFKMHSALAVREEKEGTGVQGSTRTMEREKSDPGCLWCAWR